MHLKCEPLCEALQRSKGVTAQQRRNKHSIATKAARNSIAKEASKKQVQQRYNDHYQQSLKALPTTEALLSLY
jgi:hypothetical protein